MLESILKLGLLSQEMARGMSVRSYRRKFKSSWNKQHVSLMAGQSSRKATAPHIAILVDPNIQTTKAKGLNQTKDTNRPVPKEALVKDRIPPESFIGIVMGEVGYSFRLEKPTKPRPVSLKKIVDIVKRSNLNLPVYFKGKQAWP